MPHSLEFNNLPHVLHSTNAHSIQQFALSYSAINLWIYFVIIPVTWALVIDRKLQSRYLVTLSYCVLLGFAGILEFLHKIDLFKAGCDFCVYMQRVHHCSYAESCIIWCILMPLTVTIILISLPARKNPLQKAAIFNI